MGSETRRRERTRITAESELTLPDGMPVVIRQVEVDLHRLLEVKVKFEEDTGEGSRLHFTDRMPVMVSDYLVVEDLNGETEMYNLDSLRKLTIKKVENDGEWRQ